MAALQAQCFLLSATSSSLQASDGRKRVSSILHRPSDATKRSLPLDFLRSSMKLTEEEFAPREAPEQPSTSGGYDDEDRLVVSKLYAVMEAAADRAGMHDAIGAQRDNWNTLLLGSINSMTLAASLAAGLSAIPVGDTSPHHLAFKASSVLLYSAATAMLLVVNKMQPSQLAEEQRNAARLFRQLEEKIGTALAVGLRPAAADVEDALGRVLALDKAYPLSLLPGMLEKFPKVVEPTVWWPGHDRRRRHRRNNARRKGNNNGWNEGLEGVMRGLLRVLKEKDTAEYVREARLALGLNSVLATAGPLLTGLAAGAASFVDAGSPGAWPPLVLGVASGTLAAVVNTLEHGGQAGMVFELYRNCAGFYRQMEVEIESNLEESDVDDREDGELLELKMALRLGRSLPELRELSSPSSPGDEEEAIEEFAGKLF